MKVKSTFIQLAGAVSTLATVLPSYNRANPVCIVGAGPSGLTIAHELEAKNISTVTFEKQALVGGKCQAYYEGCVFFQSWFSFPGKSYSYFCATIRTTFHPLGALLFTKATYNNTLALIQAAGVPILPGIAKYCDFTYGPGENASHVAKQPKPDPNVFKAEYDRYVSYWTKVFQPKYTALRYVVSMAGRLGPGVYMWKKCLIIDCSMEFLKSTLFHSRSSCRRTTTRSCLW